jgi:hypothetical protein
VIDHSRLRREIGTPVRLSSTPELRISPVLRSAETRKPADGGVVTRKSASSVVFRYQVTSAEMRPSSSDVSKPVSISLVRSGPSSGLPTLEGVTPGCAS